MDATDTNQGGSNANGTAEQPRIAVAATATTKSKAAKKKEAKLPKLTGKYTFIKSLVESQRVILGKTMAVHSMAMLKHHREIREKLEALARFEGANYADKHDIDPTTGTGRIKSFVPTSLRAKMPLNHSKIVKEDSRCASSYSAITTKMEAAQSVHDEYLQKLSVLSREIANVELAARKELLFCEYCDTVINIAEGLIKVGKKEIKAPATQIPEKNVAFASASIAFREFPLSHWEKLKFLNDTSAESKGAFYSSFERHIKLDHKKDVDDLMNIEAGEDHPDLRLIDWVSKKLLEFIPILSTDFWEHDTNIDEDRELDAELEELFSKKDTDKANQELEDGMEVDGDAVLEAAITKTVNKAMDKQTANRRKESRKNSSGDAKSQASRPVKNGRGAPGKSTGRHGNHSNRPSKRYNDKSDDEDSYDTHSRNRSKSRYRNSNNRQQDDRGRDQQRPRSILRNRSVSWSRSTTPQPARSRYSHGEPRRSHGTSYHNSRDSHRGSGRGGRGRGGRRK